MKDFVTGTDWLVGCWWMEPLWHNSYVVLLGTIVSSIVVSPCICCYMSVKFLHVSNFGNNVSILCCFRYHVSSFVGFLYHMCVLAPRSPGPEWRPPSARRWMIWPLRLQCHAADVPQGWGRACVNGSWGSKSRSEIEDLVIDVDPIETRETCKCTLLLNTSSVVNSNRLHYRFWKHVNFYDHIWTSHNLW
jgi:hypothetical protein